MSLWTAQRDAEHEGVVVASYRHPPMSYFCAEGTAELRALCEQWRSPDVRAVVLCGGIPGKFITHYSVEELGALAGRPELLRSLGTSLCHAYHELLRGVRDLPKPILAALNGDTMGGGFELALACDLRIGQSGDFRYGLPEALLGILPGGGGTQRLARLLGSGRALDFLLRGRVCPPEEALALGLVHEVAPDARARAVELARELAGLSPVAMAEIKRCVYQGSEVHLEAGLEIEAQAFVETLQSQEARDAMREYVAVPPEERREFLERRLALRHRR